MQKRSLAKGGSFAAVVCAAALVGVVVALASGGAPSAPPPLSSVAPGPEREARALGLGGATSERVFSLEDGDQVAVRHGGGETCLMRTNAGRAAGEACANAAGALAGEGIEITDECESSGDHLMEITGIAPEGAVEVRLLYSDGSAVTAPVTDGAFKFEGHNPLPGERYPQGVEWIGAAGAEGAAGLPVRGAEFCLPAG
jgi:hypothetical protein